MHLGLRELGEFFASHYLQQPLVLATVVATSGSTYRKTGALMLMAADGSHAGLISGGCLEDDLAVHARAVFEQGRPARVVYDLKDDPELVWGLGLGCGGSVEVLLKVLRKGEGLEVMQQLFQEISTGRDASLALVFETETDRLPMGSLALIAGRNVSLGKPWLLEALAAEPFSAGRSVTADLTLPGGATASALLIQAKAPPAVLVCGAGPDSVPLVNQVLAQGWACTVVDHRPAYARADRFPGRAAVVCQRPEQLAPLLKKGFSAAVVMSHHVEHDTHYLRALAGHPPVYIGLLGPADRRDTLLKTLGDAAPAVHGPAGLDIGAELPESIALSIMAEMHAVMNGRSAQPLSIA